MNLPEDLDLENELRRALCRIEPRKDFSALPYARRHRGHRLLALSAAIVLMVLLPFGMLQYQARNERREQAAAQLVQALQITQSKLEKTRRMVARQLERKNTI